MNGYKFHIQLQQKADTHLKDGQLIPVAVYHISPENIILCMVTALFMQFGKVRVAQLGITLILIFRAALVHSILCMEYTGKDYLSLRLLQPKMDMHFRDGQLHQREVLSINQETIIQFIETRFYTQFGVNLHSIAQLLLMQMADPVRVKPAENYRRANLHSIYLNQQDQVILF